MAKHQEHILHYIRHGKRSYPILTACNSASQTLFPVFNTQPLASPKIGSFVPAAGASTRFLQPIRQLLADPSHDMAKKFPDWQSIPLPKELRDDPRLVEHFDLPKALFPCVKEGHTFLELKHIENDSLGINDSCFVVPGSYLNAISSDYPKALFLSQDGENQTTCRYNQQGEPILDASGAFSRTPAGHGSLAPFLTQMKHHFVTADFAWIRNIDNIIGTKHNDFIKQFFNLGQWLLEQLAPIRKDPHSSQAQEVAQGLLQKFELQHKGLSSRQVAFIADHQSLCAELLCKLFDFTPYKNGPADLGELFNRPLNLFGMVPRDQKDVGGIPAIIDFEGVPTKICLEGSHIHDEDALKITTRQLQATHFNPVFVLAEIPASPDYYMNPIIDMPFVVEKDYQNQKVLYYESALYEKLSHSWFSNTLFFEIPRFCFNPHKSIFDLQNQSINNWVS
jgi:hypothetical protein